MGTIVVIGGGELSELETLEIDREVVNLTNKLKPKALFIPTASNDALGYCDSFASVYGDRLGCETRSLLLATNSYTHEEIVDAIMSADLIYVGGGNTAKMLEIWRETGVDTLLKEAYASGTVLSGLSAGSICWFEYGHSDSEAFEGNKGWKYIKLEAMGLLRGIHCPHYDEDNRSEDFMRMVQGSGLPGIAVENNCAMIFKDNEYKVISTKDTARAFTIIDSDQGVIVSELTQHSKFKPLSDLY
ncbi:Type 1 glutamine amidotransferase-like domain-containing protein [Paenibacillus sp. FSL K6-2524]|uniref:Type 1 glutamine amidotransferase-like domain-containing protein n=1 Tax=Paenibacillus sp. FSL K6-2524 TaxID=2954516 RepID=UPI0030F51BFF